MAWGSSSGEHFIANNPPSLKNLSYYNVVTDYGADPTGVVDATAAITAAINAANAAGGGIVFFPSGIFTVSPVLLTTYLPVYSNLIYRGAGWSSIIRVKANAGNYQAIFYNAGAVTNVVFEDFRIDTNVNANTTGTIVTSTLTTFQRAIDLGSATNMRIRRMSFDVCSGVQTVSIPGGAGIEVTECFANFVMRAANPLYDNSCFYIEGADNLVANNRFTGATQSATTGATTAIEMHAGPYVVSSNQIENQRVGIVATGGTAGAEKSGPNAIVGNVIKGCNAGIQLWPLNAYGLTNLAVTGNAIELANVTFAMNVSYGIITATDPTTQTGTLSDFAITGNTIRFQDEGAGRAVDAIQTCGIGITHGGQAGGAGIALNGSIADNLVELAPIKGITAHLNAGGITLQNVRIANNVLINPGQNLGLVAGNRTGIMLYCTATDVQIQQNYIRDSFATTRCAQGIQCLTGGTYLRVKVVNNLESVATTPMVDDLGRAGVSLTFDSFTATGGAASTLGTQLVFGGDALANLYRQGAGVIESDGNLVAAGNMQAQFGLAPLVQIGTVGPGGESAISFQNREILLYRVSNSVLRLNNWLTIDGTLTASGTLAAAKDIKRSKQTPAFNAAPTPDPTLGEIYAMAALTGAVNVGNPVNAAQGQHLYMIWTQDGTGGRVVAYTGSNWRSVGIAAQVTTLSTVTIDEAVCIDGTIWRVTRLVTGQTI